MNQSLTGTAAADTLTGEVGNDTINGGAGNDILAGGIGNDTINGEGDDDVIDGGLGNDVIDGGTGNDIITDNAGREGTIAGGDGNDVITAALTRNRAIDGGDGNDTIRFGNANSYGLLGFFYTGATITGGAGDDTIESYNEGVTIDGGSGHDTIVTGSAATITLGADSDILRVSQAVVANYKPSTVTDFQAGAGGDAIDLTASLALNPLGWNYEGNPFATGEIRLLQSGADVLVQGKTGAPQGGGYSTFLILQNTNIAAFIAENFSGYSPTGAPPADQVIIGTPGPDSLTGGIGNDTISGLGDNDILNGGFGADHLIGGEGNDLLEDHWGGDTLEGGNGNDILLIVRDRDHIPTTTVLMDGGDGDDIITFQGRNGSAGAGSIIGGAGNDVIATTLFNGAIDAGDGNDQVALAAASGTVALGAGNDLLTIATNSSSDVAIDGGSGNDDITIHDGSVNAGDGDDIIRARRTHDLTLGAGKDLVIITALDTTSTIEDFQVGEEGDRLDLSLFGAFPFGPNGPLMIEQIGADTRIRSNLMVPTVILLKNVTVSDLSTYNLGASTGFYNPAARNFAGTPGPDTYISADGNDSLSGQGLGRHRSTAPAAMT